MSGVLLISNGSESGKSSIILALLRLVADRGTAVRPFKPAAITSDIMEEGKYVLPWSLHAQLDHAKIDYIPNMNPILLIPEKAADEQDILEPDARYRLYYSGVFNRRLSGEEFILQLDEHRTYLNGQAPSACLMAEGMGHAFNRSSPVSSFANTDIANAMQLKTILIVDLKKDAAIQAFSHSLETMLKLGINLHGVIFTKYIKGAELLDTALKLAERALLPVIGGIPYSTDPEGSSVSQFSDWTKFVKTHVDMAALIRMFHECPSGHNENKGLKI